MNWRQIQRALYLGQRTIRDVEVASGNNGGKRIVKRVARRQVRRRVTGPLSDMIWRKL